MTKIIIKLRSELVGSISTAAKSITSVENLEQMTRAMSSITNNPKEIDTDAQVILISLHGISNMKFYIKLT